MIRYRELELVVEGAWAKQHPQQATALCMERVRRHLGPDNFQGKNVSRKRSSVHRRKKPKRKKVAARATSPPLVKGEELIRAADLAQKLGVGDSTLRSWMQSGHLDVVRRREGKGHPRVYLSESQVRGYIATQKRPQGRPRKER